MARSVSLFRSLKPLTLCFSRSIKLMESGDIQFIKPPSFDYFGGAFSLPKSIFDRTGPRLNDNSKVIVVEGNLASGKSNLASKLAGYFGMVHFPDPTEDDIYICSNHKPPFDLRAHNPLLPDFAKYYTCEMFWNEFDLVNKGKPLYLQYQFYMRRYWNYAKALCNLFNTGRGSIIDRSPFSEMAFSEALYKCGYLSERAYRWFNQVHAVSVSNLWKPHLVIYVRATNEQIRNRFKKRAIPWELNAPNLTDEFFDAYKNALEKSYVEKMRRYSEVLIIDGATTDVYDDDDINIIAQRVTEVNLAEDHLLRDDYKLLQWRHGMFNERAKINARAAFSSARQTFSSVFTPLKVPSDMHEGCYSYDAHEMQDHVLQMDPRTRIPALYNPRYNSWFNILLNPFVAPANYNADLPKQYLRM